MVPVSMISIVTLLSVFFSFATAQTWTACDPLKRTDCPANLALGMSYTFNFTNTDDNTTIWNTTAGPMIYGDMGAQFSVTKKGVAPTIQSNFYIFFGVVEVIAKAARGQGVISSIVLESDDLDEVDWEILGGNATHVETNYFGKGNTTTYDRAIYYPMNKAPQDDFHNYTIVWTSDKLEWIIDGKSIRTLLSKDANNGQNFPQTPMNLRLGVWAGGDKDNHKDTVEWAGGLTDYSKGPYSMYVSSARVHDYSSGSEYRYGDKSGSWQSIKLTDKSTKSSIAQELLNPPAPTPTLAQRWAALSKAAQIAIICSIAGVGGLLFALMTCCCVRARRAGRRQKALDDAEFEKGKAELMAYRAEMATGGRQWYGH